MSLSPDFLRDTAWMEDAACAGLDAESFFPEKDDVALTAKAVCAGCPVIDQCLEYAVDNMLVGIWGGMGERQRTEYRKGSRALHACDECGQKFANKGAVAAHFNHRHTDRRKAGRVPTPCPDCGQVFASKQGMSNHRAYKHKDVA